MKDRKVEDFNNIFEAVRYADTPKHSFSVGDPVRLSNAQRKFSASVPAHAGFTTAQFAWIETLKKHENSVGEVTRVFPNSSRVNVTFEDGGIIGIDAESLINADVDEGEKKKCKEGISGHKHRRRMRVREGEAETEFDILLGDKVYKRVMGVHDDRGGYVSVHVDQLKGEVPNSDQLYLEDDKGFRYKRVISHLPEDDTVLFKQL